MNVFIESACFDPVAHRARQGASCGIISDARYRFERGVDPEFVRAGPGTGDATDPRMVRRRALRDRRRRRVAAMATRDRISIPRCVERLGGLDVPKDEIVRILTGLGFGVSDGTDPEGHAAVLAQRHRRPPPIWSKRSCASTASNTCRRCRCRGRNAIAKPVLTPAQRRTRSVRRTLAARGFNETIIFSFIPRAHAKLFGGGDEARQLENPIAADLDALRPSCCRHCWRRRPAIRRAELNRLCCSRSAPVR